MASSTSVILGPAGLREVDGLPEEDDLAEGEFAWVHLVRPEQEEIRAAARAWGLPWPAIRATTPPGTADAPGAAPRRPHRIGLRQSGEWTFGLLRTLHYIEAESAVRTGDLTLCQAGSRLLSVVTGDADPADAARRRLAEQAGLRRGGVMGVVFALVDVLVDDYLDVLAELWQDLGEVEERVFGAEGRDDATEAIYSLKRQLLKCRNACDPLLPLAHNSLSGGGMEPPHELRVWIREGAQRIEGAANEFRSADDLLNSVFDAQQSRIATWQNEDMRKISAWAAIVAVPTLVAGVYGMNFTHMPELKWTFGYPLSLGVMAVVCSGLYRVLRKRGWL